MSAAPRRLKGFPRVPIYRLMARPPAPALAAFALVAALACAVAAFAAAHLGIGPLPGALFVGVIALGYAGCAVAVAHHGRSRAAREREELEEFTRLLAASTSESRARRLLLRHVQRLAPSAGVVLLTPADTPPALELTFGERIVDTPLLGLSSTEHAAERCRAIEVGHPREVPESTRLAASGAEADLACALCGRLSGERTCVPLHTNGHQHAALLVAAEQIDPAVRARIHEAAQRAAPVLAMQHERAVVARRAGSDPLTTLPNRAAAEQALRRLCAQAGRSVSPLAAVLLAVDQPPRLRSEREQALTLVSRRLTEAARASDFIARFADDSFLVLAPDTDQGGGLELAEKLRRQLELLSSGDGRLTGSLGVAVLPMDALAPDDLLRQADRALAVARALGGNRVQAAESTLTP